MNQEHKMSIPIKTISLNEHKISYRILQENFELNKLYMIDM